MSDKPKVLTMKDGHVWTIQINRPDVRNCVDGETAELLKRAWLEFRDDDDLWVAVLTGQGNEAFCAGADLKALTTLGPPADASAAARRRFITSGDGYMGYTRQTDIFKPIIAAIEGYCLAGGLELACMAHIRVASERAQFGVACRRYNVPLVDGGTQRLPRIVGMGHALDLIITGRFIDVNEAKTMGLVNRVAPAGQAYIQAVELARMICTLPQGALRTDLQAALMGFGRTLDEGLRIEAELGQDPMRSFDIVEGSTSFAQKRKPKFRQDS